MGGPPSLPSPPPPHVGVNFQKCLNSLEIPRRPAPCGLRASSSCPGPAPCGLRAKNLATNVEFGTKNIRKIVYLVIWCHL